MFGKKKKQNKPPTTRKVKPAKDKQKEPAKKPLKASKPVKVTKPKAPKSATAKSTLKPKATKQPAKKPEPELKHNEQYEQGTDKEKIIIIRKVKRESKPKRASRRELKRVAKTGGFTVFDGARAGKTFESQKEATAYAADVFIRTGEIVPVARTERQITHTFKAEERTDK